METDRKGDDSEVYKNGTIIAEQGKHNTSIWGGDCVKELAMTQMTHSNRISRKVISVNEEFGTKCDGFEEGKQDGLGKLTSEPLIEKMIHN